MFIQVTSVAVLDYFLTKMQSLVVRVFGFLAYPAICIAIPHAMEVTEITEASFIKDFDLRISILSLRRLLPKPLLIIYWPFVF